MQEPKGPFKVVTKCGGGRYVGIKSPEAAMEKADEAPESQVADSDGVVIYISKPKPPPAE